MKSIRTPSGDREAVQVPLNLIDPYQDTEGNGQPFQMYGAEEMEQMVESIREMGILTPVLLRPWKCGRYQTTTPSVAFGPKREAMEAKNNTAHGKLLRVNRSSQAEGVFAMTKEDMDFRRFLLRGTVKVAVEWTLLSLACNILKLHHKLQDGRLGTGLVIPASCPAGL